MTTPEVQAGLTMEIYEGFKLNQTERWNAIVHPDVMTNSPAGRDIAGREALQNWIKAFHEAFDLRVDLIDHYLVGDRGLVTINLHWKHDRGPFFGLEPTGQSGTSIESFILQLKDGLVTYFTVADQSLDLAIYLHEQGMEMPSRATPPALIAG
ncbi:ester cyclase [Sphingomonas sp. PB4P5]|uniref:ester cyclase n=1 Tax=Parasphingomonas puruogangriensis TaxID=3096155 RepID=UPI002FC73ECB